MAKQIRFTGINRAVSDYSDTGACEELINLRPTPTGLVPVKGFSKKMEGVTFNKLYEHNVGGQVNYIAVTFANDGSSLSVDRVSESGEVLSNLLTLQTPPSFSADSIHVAVTGRILTISISDKASGIYANYAFRWKNNSYSPLEANIPAITPTFSIGTPAKKYYSTNDYFIQTVTNPSIISDYLATAYSAIQTNNPSFCFGPCIVAIAYKTTDGDTFWTGQWYALDPVPKINDALSATSDNYHLTSSSTYAASFPNTMAVNGSAYLTAYQGSGNTVTHRLAGAEITINIPALASGAWNKDTSILKSIEIYVSRPVIFHDYGFSKVEPEFASVDSTVNLAVPELPAKEMGLGGQLLYLQKSYNLDELSSAQTYTLRFGGNIQVTDKTLEVDPGMIVRTGSMLAYNARYHFYNANKRVFLGKPYFGKDFTSSNSNFDVFVLYESEELKKKVYVGRILVPTSGITPRKNIITVPTINISEVHILLTRPSSHVTYYDLYVYSMNPSTTYNYSINDSGEYSRSVIDAQDTNTEIAELLALKAAGAVDCIDESETDAINVSEQYNPFVFRVNHSYLAPATVLDLQPQLMAVADISIGNAPLDVFTSQGVYALLQGDGTVLYGAFRALSNLISESNSASTDAGTFFIASGNLWRIAGLHSELVSDALSLGPHKEIRSCGSYHGLSRNSARTYDIEPYESDPMFEDYSKGAAIVYNRFRDELIISNPSYGYSYVLSLKYKQWFKIPYTYSQEIVGSDLATLSADTKVLPGTFARLIVYSTPEGEDIDYNIWVNDRTYIEFQTHTVTAEEASASTPQLLAAHLVSEWNAQAVQSGHPLTATAGTSTAVYSEIQITFTDSVDDVQHIDSHFTMGDASQWPVFKTPHDIYDFSDEIESETTHIIPANVSQEIKINTYPGEGDGFQFILTFNGTTTNILHITTAEEDADPTGKLIPHFVAEINANATVQALGLSVEALNTPDIIDLLVSTTRALDDTTGNGMLLKTLFDDWGEEQTIASTALNIPVSITAHLQSRPISFGYQYTHIHRVVDMVRSTLRSANNLTVALYGSDDLHTWTLLSYANREGSAAGLSLSQLRTPSTARAWRYYTITIGGIIPVDTDFGPVLLDEAPVVRRIG